MSPISLLSLNYFTNTRYQQSSTEIIAVLLYFKAVDFGWNDAKCGIVDSQKFSCITRYQYTSVRVSVVHLKNLESKLAKFSDSLHLKYKKGVVFLSQSKIFLRFVKD